MLYYEGLGTKPNDIDIIVDEKDVARAKEIMGKIGIAIEMPPKEPYRTKYFYRYNVNGTEIDMFSGFRIKHSKGVYEYDFDESKIKKISIGNVKIPLTFIEDWYLLYQLIPNREPKVQMIEKHFREKGIVRKEIINSFLDKDIPNDIKDRIEGLLKNIKSILWCF